MSTDPQAVVFSVVIPLYNEAGKIEETTRRVAAFMSLKKTNWELLLSEDGSTDNTAAIVEAVIQNKKDLTIRLLRSETGFNAGKGEAVRRGVLAARGDYVLVTDADLSSPIKELDKLLAALDEGCEVAIGSRAVRAAGCDVQQSFKRKLSGRIFSGLVRCIALKGFSDTQCGFKCFKKEAARRLFEKQTLKGFGFDVEILRLAQIEGLKVKEVPVMWKEGPDSRVKLLRDSVAMLKDLFYIRKRYR